MEKLRQREIERHRDSSRKGRIHRTRHVKRHVPRRIAKREVKDMWGGREKER